MARRATGTVIPPEGQRRSWAIRFHAYGKRRYFKLGRPEDGWNRRRALEELDNVLADVRRGIWQPAVPNRGPVEALRDPTLREFAQEWFEASSAGWRRRTQEHYSWALDNHLLPYFGEHRLSAITVKEVDCYRGVKVRESKNRAEARNGRRPLCPRTINNSIRVLGTMLQLAVEYGYINRNPAFGRKRLLKEPKRPRSYLQPEQAAALLRAAGRMDEEARKGDCRRRQTLLAVMALAGLRISEVLDLRWLDVDQSGRWLEVAEAKTDAGVRRVHLTPALQELLVSYRARARRGRPKDRVFPTKKGKRDNPSNIRNRLLPLAVQLANEELGEAGYQEIGAITPHSLRRTYISLALAAGADVPYVMQQAGHSDPRMTLSVYAGVIASKADHGAALDGLVGDL